MKLTVVADIHGNLEALDAVLNEIDASGTDKVVSLGDNVGYGPDPEPVMRIMTARHIESVLGNHELAVKRPGFERWFNPVSRKAVHHTRAHLSVKSIAQIHLYPRHRLMGECWFVHGAPPSSVTLYLFQLPEAKLKSHLTKMAERIVFVGHTHDLGMMIWNGEALESRPLEKGRISLNPRFKYVINAGSVGQPRDGTPHAKYVVVDTVKNTLEVRYVSYDYEKTAEKIIRAGLPSAFAAKLMPMDHNG